MFGAGMLFLGVLLGVVGIAVYKSQVTYSLFILYPDFDVIMPNQSIVNTFWQIGLFPEVSLSYPADLNVFTLRHIFEIFEILLFQCLPDEVAELRDHRRELERQRQHQQDLLRSEVIQSEEELLKKDVTDHTEV